ncbi:MAG: hypothetical protein JWN52_4452 [Actinomycetia bacterium]|nr:hypothetical protein [Actinomycetes bacterium]
MKADRRMATNDHSMLYMWVGAVRRSYRSMEGRGAWDPAGCWPGSVELLIAVVVSGLSGGV